MKTNRASKSCQRLGKRALTAGLIAWACHVDGTFCCVRADGVPQTPAATAQQKGWSQGVILTEIAWLANPATFHERLTAVQVGDCLEIHGTVSNDANRNLAMTLAREASHMTTVDHMKNALAPALPAPGRSLDMIYRDSVHALYHSCPKLSRGLTITTQDQGEVLVRGEVPTIEDKLAVSRALKGVAGCNCVKNQVRTRSATVETLNAAAAKPTLQDNSLLVRLGLMQPRTEIVSPAPMVARNMTPIEIPKPASTRPQIAVAPVVVSNRLTVAANQPIVPALAPTATSHIITEPKTPQPSEGQILLTSSSSSGMDTEMLARAIALTCRLELNRIRVVAGEGKSLTITLAVTDLEAGKQMAAKVLAMPELVPFGVNLDVSLAR